MTTARGTSIYSLIHELPVLLFFILGLLASHAQTQNSEAVAIKSESKVAKTTPAS